MGRVHITAAEAVTPLGSTSATTAAAIRASVNRVIRDDRFPDLDGNPLPVCMLPDEEGLLEPLDRVGPAALAGLRTLMESFDAVYDRGRPCHLLLGGAHPDRGGALYEDADDLLPVALASELTPWFGTPTVEVFEHGNAAGLFALDAAVEILSRDTRSVCIVGAADSLLDEELLERFEEDERLVCDAYPSAHGFAPGEAVGWLAVESETIRSSRPPLAVVESVAVGVEPYPYESPEPSVGEGLTDVIRRALRGARSSPDEVDAVLIDLDGEHHRALEWSYADVRCLGDRGRPRTLVHPSDGYGTVGAASGVLLLTLVAAARGWLDGVDLVLTSDDHGPRGAAVLRRRWKGH